MDATPSPTHSRTRAGLAFGIGAYGIWGLLPIYFKLLQGVPAINIVAHRIVWSVGLLAVLLLVTRTVSQVRTALRHPGTMRLLTATAVLIGGNWLLYIYAVNSGHILAGSLGYYLNPIANILLGRFVLKEPLNRVQWGAVALAGLGVAILAVGALSHLWISLLLCGSFAAYGLLRKIAHVDAVAGMAIETTLLLPFALLWLLWLVAASTPVMGSSPNETALLVFSGVASTVPLLMFTAAARRLRYSTLGILQFLAPTLQFLVAVFLYGEPFTTAHAFAFAAIWTAAILYLISSLKAARPMRPE